MVGRNKGFSAKQSKRTSRRMQDSTLGTHVRRNTTGAAANRQNASSLSFSNQRSTQGSVSPYVVDSSAYESASVYRHRASQRRYIEEQNRRARRKRVLIGIVIAVVVLAAAAVAGYFAFMGSIGSNMALRNSDARDALTVPKTGEPYYVLVTAELGSVAAPLDNGGPDVILLVRVDERDNSLNVISIPHNLQVNMTDNERHRLTEYAAQGDAALINAIKKYTEVDIAHIVKIDEPGFVALVDELGGIDVTLTQEIDDPHAGDLYFSPGTYTMSGKQALVYLRATNLTLGQRDQLDNQMDFALKIFEKLFNGSSTVSFATRLDTIGSFFQTDYSSGDLVSLANRLTGFDASTVPHAAAPGYVDIDTTVGSDGSSFYVSSAADMRAMIARLDAGEPLVETTIDPAANVDPASFTLEIQNGTDIVGAAAATQDSLVQKGFNVVEIGNAEQSVYDETLVVYINPEYANAAQSVVNAMGVGRVVDGAAYYEFSADVLLILGKDYKPTA